MSSRSAQLTRRLSFTVFAVGLLLAVIALAPVGGSGEPDYVVERHVLTIAPELQPAGEHHEGEVAAAYRINNNIWDVADLPVEVRFNSSGSLAALDPESLIRTGIDVWNAVAGSAFEFTWGGSSDAEATTCARPYTMDGLNTIKFVTSLPPGTLGVTCTVWSPGKANAPLLEFDMQLNSTINWGAGPIIPPGQYDLASTILHELGHAAGLGHPCGIGGDGCSPAEEASVMFPSLVSQMQKRELRSDDIAAIVAAYPQAQVTPATPSPTATPTATPTTPPPTVTAPAGGLSFLIRAPAVARD